MILVMAWAWLENLGAEVQSSWNRNLLLGWKISGVAVGGGRPWTLRFRVPGTVAISRSRGVPRDECIDLYRHDSHRLEEKKMSAYCIHIHVHAFVAFSF